MSEVFPEKKIFEVGQLLLVLGTPQLRPFFFKIWEKSPKSPYFRNEVAQLQKKFFFEFVYLPYFESGILVTCNMLSENVIFDHFYG